MKTKTKAEQRVEIAKDVLKHIKAEKIKIKVGEYFNSNRNGSNRIIYNSSSRK